MIADEAVEIGVCLWCFQMCLFSFLFEVRLMNSESKHNGVLTVFYMWDDHVPRGARDRKVQMMPRDGLQCSRAADERRHGLQHESLLRGRFASQPTPKS